MNRSLFIGIPAYSGAIKVPTVEALHRFIPIAAREKIVYPGPMFITDTDVSEARNTIADRFMRSTWKDPEGETHPFSHLLMIDDDIAFDPEVIPQMMKLGVPIVGGIVPMRRLNERGQADRFNVHFAEHELGEKVDRVPDETGCIDVDGVGTAFMLIERATLVGMLRVCDTYSTPQRFSSDDDGARAEFFRRGTWGGAYLGEDYFFCRAAQVAGFKVKAYARANFGHVGQHMFGGDVMSQRKTEK